MGLIQNIINKNYLQKMKEKGFGRYREKHYLCNREAKEHIINN
jgi:hypothetical protein